MLTLTTLNQSYGGSHTLWDVDLAVPQGRDIFRNSPWRKTCASAWAYARAAIDPFRIRSSTCSLCWRKCSIDAAAISPEDNSSSSTILAGNLEPRNCVEPTPAPTARCGREARRSTRRPRQCAGGLGIVTSSRGYDLGRIPLTAVAIRRFLVVPRRSNGARNQPRICGRQGRPRGRDRRRRDIPNGCC